MPYFQYPLKLRFKLVALAPRIIVTDANGMEVLYIHQKTFAWKEDIRIYRDQSKAEEVYRINAEKVIDFNTRYNITEIFSGKEIGNIKSKGWRSIWKATYHLADGGDMQTHTIEEENPWVKVADTVLGELPVIGIFTGYFLHPRYNVIRLADGAITMSLVKEPAFFEGVYTIELQDQNVSHDEEIRSLMGLVLMVQFMRGRG